MMSDKLTQAAGDIVWGDSPDAFPPARRLMFAAMRCAITPLHVWRVNQWATSGHNQWATSGPTGGRAQRPMGTRRTPPRCGASSTRPR